MAKSRQRGNGQGSLFKRKGRGAWIARWYDHDGKRREKSTRTTDKAAAERILKKLTADAALRREGVIDPMMDQFATEGRRPLSEHVADYITHCRHAGHNARHVAQKQRHLDRFIQAANAHRLNDLTADGLERHMARLREDDGLSARSANFARQIVVAFASWCVKNGRLERNPLSIVPKLDERGDRRRVRRPLTDEELAALLRVAEPRGRKPWYLAAALAGLRKGDLQRLIWADVDFENNAITVRHGKAKRTDVIPMHPQLADELRELQGRSMAMPRAQVFPTTVTDRTRQRDFLRAGLAREEVVRDENGDVVLVGSGRHKRPKTRIVAEDAEGRVIDLHAMRTTLGTNLARAGVAPQIAQQIMRHGDYRTTLKHYTVLGLTDTARAIEELPDIGSDSPDTQRATGTADTTPTSSDTSSSAKPRQRVRPGAMNIVGERRASSSASAGQQPTNATPSDTMQETASKRVTGLEPATFSLEG